MAIPMLAVQVWNLCGISWRSSRAGRRWRRGNSGGQWDHTLQENTGLACRLTPCMRRSHCCGYVYDYFFLNYYGMVHDPHLSRPL